MTNRPTHRMPSGATVIEYKPVPTAVKFHKDRSFVRGLMGPVRSGKSTAMCHEIMRRAVEQKPSAHSKLRRTKFAVVRNTYRELEDTTLKTWLMWFPEEIFGKFNYRSMTHTIKFDDVHTDIMFRALDRPEDIRKLLSMEITGAWVNEAREIPKGVIDTLTDRVGQYPPKTQGGPTWYGVIMDTNPPDQDHWWYVLAEEETPRGWKFFRQPGALMPDGEQFVPNPRAENVDNLSEGVNYYLTRSAGKSRDYILVYYCGQYGFVSEGKPVFPEYVDSVHAASEPIAPNPKAVLYVGLDFGLTPAAIFAQRLPPYDRWVWLDEIVTEDMGAVRFAEILLVKLREEYTKYTISIFGDPAGEQRSQTDERTPYQILAACGIHAKPAPSNDFTLRREALAKSLQRLCMDGKPAFLISPRCKVTRKGLAGGYCYRRMHVSGDERYHDHPYKNRYSHPVEAGLYAMIGAGEGKAVITKPTIKHRTIPHRQFMTGDSAEWMGM